MGRLSMLAATVFTASVISLAAQGAAPKVTFTESARIAILSGSVVNAADGAEWKANSPLVLTPTGIDTGAVAADEQPVQFQIGKTKRGEPVFASFGVAEAPSFTPNTVKALSGNFFNVWKGGQAQQLPILMCAADGPCAKTCTDKQGKPYCCKYECK